MAFLAAGAITGVGDVDQSVITLWRQGYVFAATPELVVNQVVTFKEDIGAKAINFKKMANIAIPSALVEADDPASVALVDSSATATPVEEGTVVTYTKLANLQAGGQVDTAAAFIVGRNAGATADNRGITALEAFSTTRIYPNAATAAGNLATTDNLDKMFGDRLYNKLARANVPPLMGGQYIGIAHDDALFDLRGSLVDVMKYATPETVLRNEVGMACGIRWLRSSNVTVTADSNGTIDSYKVNVLGLNALGLGVSSPVSIVFAGPFDKLLRFVNVGWYGVYQYVIVDTANMVQGIVASSVGAN